MPVQSATRNRRSGPSGSPVRERSPGPVVVIVVIAALLGFLVFLYLRYFGAPVEMAVRTPVPTDAPEKYGLPLGAPPQAIEMRKRLMNGATASHPGK